jgi:hypothetical protein
MRPQDEIKRISELPVNQVKSEVLQFMQTRDYQRFAEVALPVFRIFSIYSSNKEELDTAFMAAKNLSHFEDSMTEARSESLLRTIGKLYNYISIQYSLRELLKAQAKKLEIKNELLSIIKKLSNQDVVRFFGDFRNNIVHELIFRPLLKFDAKNNYEVYLVYPIDELKMSSSWGNSQRYLSKFRESVNIGQAVEECHTLMIDFDYEYEKVLYNSYNFKKVLVTLLTFSDKYRMSGVEGFLPVPELFIKKKLEFLG